MSLANFKDSLRKPGNEGESLRAELTKFTAWLVGKVVDYVEGHGGSREGMRLASWPDKHELHKLNLFVIEWQAPEEQCMEHSRYVAMYGDPAANGRGDKTVTGPQGQHLVQLKGDGVWVKRTKWINQVQKQQKIIDSTNDFGQ